MGTSKTYGGPRNINPLIPPWPDDAPPPDETGPGPSEQEPGGEAPPDLAPRPPKPWRVPKAAMTELAMSVPMPGVGNPRVRDVTHGFVRALGGPQGAAAGARAGRQTAARLGAFFAAVVRDGLPAAADAFGVGQYLGRSAADLLTALGTVVAPPGALAEGAAARDAFHETMAMLLEELGPRVEDAVSLAALGEDDLRRALELYVGNYITARLLQTLAEQIETGATSPERAVRVEAQVRDYVTAVVRLELRAEGLAGLDWGAAAGGAMANRVFVMGFRVLEAAL